MLIRTSSDRNAPAADENFCDECRQRRPAGSPDRGPEVAGLATRQAPEEIVRELAALHPRNDTFPGEELLELAADAIEESGASRSAPIEYEDIRERYLADYEFHGRQDHARAIAERRAIVLP